MGVIMNKLKRVLCLFFAVLVLTSSITFSYYHTTKCAEWVAGVVASVGGGPLLTALLVGGVVVAGGIAVHELIESDPEDFQDFWNGCKDSFTGYCEDFYYKKITQSDALIDTETALAQAAVEAGETVKNFTDNVIDQTVTTGRKLKDETVELWQGFCNEVSDIVDNGLADPDDPTGDLAPDATIFTSVYNTSSLNNLPYIAKDNIGANCRKLDDRYYVINGDIVTGTNLNIYNCDLSSNIYNNSQTYNFPYVILRIQTDGYYAVFIELCRCTVSGGGTSNTTIGTYREDFQDISAIRGFLEQAIPMISIPVMIVDNVNQAINDLKSDIALHYQDYLEASRSFPDHPAWKRTVDDVFDNTAIGQSIRTGRRVLSNEGDEITSVFQEDQTIVKKGSLATDGEVATGTVGWDIPNDRVWDDVIDGALPWRRVIDDTGAIGVPRDETDSTPDGAIEYPEDTPVDDPARPDDPADEDEDPTTPDILEDQAGNFYPYAFDLSDIFPFCIPFDILYLFEQYKNVEASAPEFDLVFAYPTALQGSLGSAFEYHIDFSDYVTLRNIIRIFLLLGFVVGLMKITRDIIRG